MFFDRIIHGTQYYRSPTPLPTEWEDVIATFENNSPAIQLIHSGNGKIYLCGIPMGYTYGQTEAKSFEEFFVGVMNDCGIERYKFADFKNGIYEKHLLTPHNKIIFLFNNSVNNITTDLESEIVAFGADACVEGSKITVKAGEIGYAVIGN